jgi:hypothetical protein
LYCFRSFSERLYSTRRRVDNDSVRTATIWMRDSFFRHNQVRITNMQGTLVIVGDIPVTWAMIDIAIGGPPVRIHFFAAGNDGFGAKGRATGFRLTISRRDNHE